MNPSGKTEQPEKKESRLITNMGLSLISWALPLILSFVAAKILITQLGNEVYGYYAIALGFLNFAFTSGVSRVALKYIPEYRASGDENKVIASTAFSFWLGSLVTAAQGIILALLVPVLIENVLLIPDVWKPVMYPSLYLVCLAGMMMSSVQLFQAILQALHKFRLFAVLTSINGLILSIGNIILAMAGHGIQALIIWNLAAILINSLMLYFFVRRSFPAFIFRPTFDRELTGKMLKFAGSIVVYQAFTSFLFVFERSWVLRKFGAESVTYYVIPLMLGIYLHALLNSIVLTTIPIINELLQLKQRLLFFYREISKIVLTVISLILLNYILLGREFLGLWLGSDFAANSYSLLIIHAVAHSFFSISMVTWYMAEAIHHPGINALSTTTTVFIALLLIVVLADTFMVDGIAFGRLAGAAVCLPLIFYVEKKCFGKIEIGFWLKSIAHVLLASMLFIIFIGALRYYPIDSWLYLIFAGTTGSIIFLGCLFITGHLNLTNIKQLRRSAAETP